MVRHMASQTSMKRQRPRSVGADALHGRALGAQGREVVADPAALLHGQRGFAQMSKDTGHVVLDRAHDEAIEQRYPSVPYRHPARMRPAGRNLEIVHGVEKTLFPRRRVIFDRRQSLCDTRAKNR